MIPMIDAGISNQNYPTHERGSDKNIWVMDPVGTDKPYFGQGLSGELVYPDWQKSET